MPKKDSIQDKRKNGCNTSSHTHHRRDNSDSQTSCISVVPIFNHLEEEQMDEIMKVMRSISYKKGVTVTDNQDKNPNLSIDTSKVNLQQEGTYEVIYIATDQAGNKAKLKAIIRVVSQRESKIIIEEVPLICQKPKLPTGCEIVAATMVLQFYNENIVEEEFANKWIEKDNFFTLRMKNIWS